MNIRPYHGWRWTRFNLGFVIDFYDRGLDTWICLGFYYVGIEIWRKP